MGIPRILIALAFLVLGSIPTPAGDLTKVDRAIAKEPAYRAKPRYCLLLFGPEAKTRVWLVQDGDTLYMDRNGNGDLTEAGEKVPWTGDTVRAGHITGRGWQIQASGVLAQVP